MDIKNMSTSDIKCMLTTMNTQIENSNNKEAEFLEDFYKDFIDSCENKLKTRSKNT